MDSDNGRLMCCLLCVSTEKGAKETASSGVIGHMLVSTVADDEPALSGFSHAA